MTKQRPGEASDTTFKLWETDGEDGAEAFTKLQTCHSCRQSDEAQYFYSRNLCLDCHENYI